MAIVSRGDALSLVRDGLVNAGASRSNAIAVAKALVQAEIDGLAFHGLARVPGYAEQVRRGKVNGRALPRLRWHGNMLGVDACDGFVFPALEEALAPAIGRCRTAGIVGVAIRNSHHLGVAGHPAERIAQEGLVGLVASNSPAAVAPWGGNRALFGTNPLAFACPRRGGAPLVIDLSMAQAARGKLALAANEGRAIPQGWALDNAGHDTTDPHAAMDGTLLPAAGPKGSALVLMIELLCGALSASAFSHEASSVFTGDGGPARLGQFILVIDPGRVAGEAFADRVEGLLQAMQEQPGVRLPGERRVAVRDQAQGRIYLPDALVEELRTLAAAG